MQRMPFVRHPWYPQGAYLHRGGRLHAPVPDPMGAFGEDYTYGVFSSKTPYARIDRHTGLDGYYSFGADVAGDPCGVTALKAWLKAELLKLEPFKTAVKIDFTGTVTDALDKGLNAAGDAGISALFTAAQSGAGAAKGYFASNLASPIAAKLASVMGKSAPSGTMLANLFNGLADKVVYWVGSCTGPQASTDFDPAALTANPAYCTDRGYQAVATKPGEYGYIEGSPWYRCALAAPAAQTFLEAYTAQGLPSAIGTKADAIQKMIRSGELQVTSLYKSTTPSTNSTTSSASSGAGGVAVIGGLALLALLLLR